MYTRETRKVYGTSTCNDTVGSKAFDLSPAVTMGQRFFSLMSHVVYDVGLYRIVNPVVWRCSTETLLNQYRQNGSGNHLEIGVGTGFLLSKILSDVYPLRLVLIDLNESCLRKSARRLEPYFPVTYRYNVLDSVLPEIEKFDSIAINYVLHCVDGSFEEKCIAFTHIHEMLNDGGVCFGATVLAKGARNSLAAKVLMKFLNMLGIFRNEGDDLTELETKLRAVFRDVEIEVHGSVALFKALR